VVSTPPEHLSSSAVQTKAEKEIVASLATILDIGLKQQPGKIALQGGVYIEVDAVTDDDGIVVEAYARQGRLKGAQLKKVAQDILKLALLKREPDRTQTEAIIAFASQEAHDSISGWVRQAAKSFGVRLEVVPIPEALRQEILTAQGRQVMVNVDEIADDVAPPVASRFD